jgi:GTP-binding protein
MASPAHVVARRVAGSFASTSYSSPSSSSSSRLVALKNKCFARFNGGGGNNNNVGGGGTSRAQQQKQQKQQQLQQRSFAVAARGFFSDAGGGKMDEDEEDGSADEGKSKSARSNFFANVVERGDGEDDFAGAGGDGSTSSSSPPIGEGEEYSGVPLRSTISQTDLQKMERLIDEIVDNKNQQMSNRAKFRALPVTNKHRKQIEELEACVSLSEAGKRARILRNRASKAASEGGQAEAAAELNVNPTLRRYVLYGVVPEAHKDLLGRTKRRNTKFIAAASKSVEEMPSTEVKRKDENGMDVTEEVPEVAFCGRSNVGKSSLINAITLSAAARSSDTPGKTKSLNFYDIDSRLRVVDLPGYGFAFADESMVETWNRLMDEYLTTRPNLKCIFVVIDSRHGPKKSDREMLSYLSKYGKVPVHVVLNKTDMVRTDELCKRMFLLERELKFVKRSSNVLKLASASTGAGCTALFSEAFQYALPDADISRRNKREKARLLEEALEEEEAEQDEEDDDKRNAARGRSGGGKKFNKKAQQQQQQQRKEQTFVMGGEWIPGEGPAVPPQNDKKKKGGGKRGGGGLKGVRL